MFEHEFGTCAQLLQKGLQRHALRKVNRGVAAARSSNRPNRNFFLFNSVFGTNKILQIILAFSEVSGEQFCYTLFIFERICRLLG